MGISLLAARKAFEFTIYLWGLPEVDDPEVVARAVAKAGFTLVDGDRETIDVFAKYGLKVMVRDPSPDVVAALQSHPVLWGYHLADEPYPEEAFFPLAEKKRELRAIDSDPYYFVNMLSTTGEFLRTYIATFEPEILSFDYYQWWWGSDRYFEKLEEFRDQAVLAGIPLGSCIEVDANPGIERGDRTYLADNRAKLRQSVYTNLAYGVKAIEWFSAGILFEPGTTKLAPWGEDVAAINREIAKVGPELARLRSIDVYHTAPLPRGTSEAPKEHWVQLIGEEDRAGLVYGMFEDEEGTDYVLVANRDYDDSQSVTVRLQSKWLGIAPWHEAKRYSYGVERLDGASGGWETVSSTSFVGFTFVLDAADGELFRITTRLEP
ncbi:MAG TPA: hypothetical protein VEK15_19300 [Vicinamibacteria bacterium]|nr:hypothetical protein [Vicinamibacteria bacterium]